MFEYNGKEYRNLQEQVEKNKSDIEYILEEEGVLNEFGIKVIGEEADVSDLPSTDSEDFANLEYGDAYAIGTEAPYTLYVKTRANGTHPNDYWFNIGLFPNPGPQGEPGQDGADGEQGPRGYTFTPSVDADGNISWTNDGGLVNPTTVNIKGPQGDTGPVGPTSAVNKIYGILPSTANLPTPTVLNDLSVAYLIGASAPYDLYIQVGKTPATAVWTNQGEYSGPGYWEASGTTIKPATGFTDVQIGDLEVTTSFSSKGTTTTRNVLPETNNTYDLGSSSYRWKTVFANIFGNDTSGYGIKIQNWGLQFTYNGNEIGYISNSTFAIKNGNNIGEASKVCNYVYTNNISDGTNSITVAQIVAKQDTLYRHKIIIRNSTNTYGIQIILYAPESTALSFTQVKTKLGGTEGSICGNRAYVDSDDNISIDKEQLSLYYNSGDETWYIAGTNSDLASDDNTPFYVYEDIVLPL